MKTAQVLFCTALIAGMASAAEIQFGKPVTLTGICDASAAIFDAGRVLVLNDEDQQQTDLRLYDPTAGGGPARIVRLSPESLALDAAEPEIDLEAAAIVGGRLYMTGSHSRSKKAKVRVSRQRLFAIRWPIRANDVHIEGKPYVTLLSDLQGFLKTAQPAALRGVILDKDTPPENGGVSIEGLAATPEGDLLIGFRSPVIGGKAFVITLKSPERLLKGERARFAEPALLDLGRDGVRDLVWDAAARSYLILSGPVGSGSEFGIYRWDGNPDHPPTLRKRATVRSLGIKEGVAPEALAINSGDRTVWMFFDEGDRPVNGKDCKESNQKSFRGVTITGL